MVKMMKVKKMAADMLGQKINNGDIIAYSQRRGNSGTLTIGIVIDSANHEVLGLKKPWNDDEEWGINTKTGKLNNYERTIKLKPGYIKNPALKRAINHIYNIYDGLVGEDW